MRCFSRSYLFGLVFSLAVFFTIFSTVNNVSAVSDLSYTWDYDNHSELYVCGGATGIDCSDYSYVKFHPTSSCTGNGASFYVFGVGSFNGNSLISACSDIIAPVNTTPVRLTGGVNVASNYSGSIVITLMESLSPNSPSGSITLTENGTFDVSSYATAVVDVPPTVVQGDYHDDLVSIKNSIYVGAAVLLVLYFFYCIYRMIIKTTGGYNA